MAAAEGSGKVTASSVEAAVSGPPPRVASKVPKDGTGVEIPKECFELWETADEDSRELLCHISAVRSYLNKAQTSGNKVFVEVDFAATLAHLNQAYSDVKRSAPYAVCPTCQGKLAKGCLSCKGRGFVSEFYWVTFVPEETKAMRSK